jgi:hypothetical protein
MELLEEVGLKASTATCVAPHELPLDAAWLDLYSKRTASQRGKVVMDDWNKFRQLAGLPLLGTGYQVATGHRAALSAGEGAAAVLARKATPARCSRARRCRSASQAAAPPRSPRPTSEERSADLAPLARRTVNGKDLEMIVAISGVANISGIPAQSRRTEHAGSSCTTPKARIAASPASSRRAAPSSAWSKADSG